jgi:Ca2+-binding RTX toxin-like protein
VTCEVVEVTEGVFELRITGTGGPDDIFVHRVPGHEEERLFEVVLDSKDVLCVVTIDVVQGGSIVGQLTSLRVDAGEGEDHVTVSLDVPSAPGPDRPPLHVELHGDGDGDRLEMGTLEEIFEDRAPQGSFFDAMFGDDGGDTISGGGLLSVDGGRGPDTIGVVGDGSETAGGGGADTVLSGGDGITVDGGGSSDTIKVEGEADEVNGGGGNDDIEKVENIVEEIEFVFVIARPTAAAPTVVGAAPAAPGSVFNGGAGNDRFDTDDGTRDTVIGGSGRDTAIVDRKDVVRGVERVK